MLAFRLGASLYLKPAAIFLQTRLSKSIIPLQTLSIPRHALSPPDVFR